MNGLKLVDFLAVGITLSVITGCNPKPSFLHDVSVNNVPNRTSYTNAVFKLTQLTRLTQDAGPSVTTGIPSKHLKISKETLQTHVDVTTMPKSSLDTHKVIKTPKTSLRESSSSIAQIYQQQLKQDAQAQAQAMAKIEYQDTHNPRLDGQISTEHAGLGYKGTGKGTTVLTQDTTVPISPGQTVQIHFNTGNSTSTYTLSGGK